MGDYQVMELLGSGGMGEVYLVEERGSRERYAMKMLRSGAPASELWRRFMNEGRVLSGLRHPNIAAFREMFQCGESLCLVMEYVDGETLFACVRRLGRLPVDQALAVLTHLCEALSYLQARGVLHRDVKSANVKITSTGAVKLLDFGIAKVWRTPGMTAAGAVMGTPEYLSPEQAGGAPADARSEIWALGLLAYEMLTGRLPFEATDEGALFYAIRHNEPAPPSHRSLEVPPAVDALVRRCLDKRPSRRFQSAAEMQRELRRLLAPRATAERLRVAPGDVAARVLAWWRGLARGARLAIAAALIVLLAVWMFGGGGNSGDVRTITVEVVEGAADVYADGRRVGRTPYKMDARLGESVQLELRKPGYQDQPIQFEVTERKAYSYALQPAAPR
jgi:serine/threonine-protein kinase